MRRFKFGLQRVLDYRQTLEDKLLGELGAVQAEHERESGRLTEMSDKRESFKDNMRDMLASGDPEEIRQANAYFNDLTLRMLVQRARVAEIGERKDKKMAEVVEAAKERKALERLCEYKVAEHRQEAEQQEQKFLDDLASIRYGRARRAA